MDIDILRQISAVARTVSRRERDGRPVRVVAAARSYPTTVDDLWDTLTSAERIPRWFLPISGDLRQGGRYQLEGNAGGEITRCDPPRSLSVTWEYGGEVSWLEVRLSEDGADATRLELEHFAPVDDERWKEFGPGAVGVGWDLALLGLHLYVTTTEPVDRQAVAGWMEEDGGKDFVRRSSTSWGDASAVAGMDREAARAAAARTTAAYTGEDGATTGSGA